METTTIVLIISFALGIIFSVVGILIVLGDLKTRKEGIKTLATVIEVREEASSDGVTYRKVLEFTDNKGETIVQQLNYSSARKPKKTVPFKEPIFYLKKGDKIKISLANSRAIAIMGYLFILCGIIFIAAISSSLL